jgi:hypothetical protein
MRIHSYTGPFLVEGADYPQLELNIQIGTKPNYTKGGLTVEQVPDVHWAAITIVRQDLIEIALPILALLGVPLNSTNQYD